MPAQVRAVPAALRWPLAEEAVPVADLKADEAQARLEAAEADIKTAETAHDKANAERALDIARAQIQALTN